MDYAHKQTDKHLKELERRISTTFEKSLREIRKESKPFFDWLKKEEKRKKKQLKDGQITRDEYNRWRLLTTLNSDRYKRLEEKLCRIMLQSNKVAAAYINGDMNYIFRLNANYAAYDLFTLASDYEFDLWDEDTVKRLLVEQPDLLPEAKVNAKIDLTWNRKQISKAITSSILQGKTVPQIANDLMERLKTVNKSSAINKARTAATSAQNAGRQARYDRAEQMGLKIEKEWIATLDGRTRKSHRKLDGERVPKDGKFSNGLRYPGDNRGKPEEVWGCRCTMVAKIKGIKYTKKRMAYEEWEASKNGS